MHALRLADPRPGESLLDWGCGDGRLTEFLLPDKIVYVGYDPSTEMIDRARRVRAPETTFIIEPPDLTFDVTVAIGPWNLADDGPVRRAFEDLRLLWARTDRVLVASLYRGDDPRCNSFRPSGMVEFFEQLTPSWLIDCSHLGNDVMVALWRS